MLGEANHFARLSEAAKYAELLVQGRTAGRAVRRWGACARGRPKAEAQLVVQAQHANGAAHPRDW
eukprot:scaffold1453_cov112-Isochrysis_galbana.AAC.18